MALLDYLSLPPAHPRRWLGTPAKPVPMAGPLETEALPLPTVGPLPIPPAPNPRIGTAVPANSSTLEGLMAERAALSRADVSSPVSRSDWGYEIAPPERTPSRTRQALIGALQGAAMAGQSGDPWAALGGAATGAATGGISPRLMQAFTRQQELDRLAGNIATEQGIQAKQAGIYATEAQPELRALQIQRQIDVDKQREADRQRRAEDRDLDRQIRAGEATTRSEQAATANKLRQETLAETTRHNKAMEGRPTGTNERTVNNAIWQKDANGVWRLAPGSPPPMSSLQIRQGEKADERAEKGRQAAALFQKGSDYWDQAQQRREAARKLELGSDGQPSRIAATRNAEAIKRLIKEAEGLEQQTREVQIRGDMLAAESDSGPQAATGSRTIEGAVEAFKKAKGRAPTQLEIDRMKAALKGR